MIKKFLKYIYLFLIFIFLYAPIMILIVLSFNDSKSRASWGGFSFKWYIELFQNEPIISSFITTIVLGFLSAFIATVLGVLACIGIQGLRKRSKSMVIQAINIPILNAEIVTAISLMLLFIALRIEPSFMTVLLSHITINVPYVILSVLPKIRQFNMSIYEAALDLGATPSYAFRKIVLPDLLPSVLSGFLIAFTMSLDDFIITYFTKGPGFDTLSTKIYTELKKGVKPEMYALSTIMFVVVLIILIIINIKPARRNKK